MIPTRNWTAHVQFKRRGWRFDCAHAVWWAAALDREASSRAATGRAAPMQRSIAELVGTERDDEGAAHLIRRDPDPAPQPG
ncbi:MAG: hypothetical protein SangKO_009200 [Sandaracinaceae bacterium]